MKGKLFNYYKKNVRSFWAFCLVFVMLVTSVDVPVTVVRAADDPTSIEVVIPEKVGDNGYLDSGFYVKVQPGEWDKEKWKYSFTYTPVSMGWNSDKTKDLFCSDVLYLDQNGTILKSSMFKANVELGQTYSAYVTVPLEIRSQVSKMIFRENALYDVKYYYGEKLPADVPLWDGLKVEVPESLSSYSDDGVKASIHELGFERVGRGYDYYFKVEILEKGYEDGGSFQSYAYIVDKDGKVLKRESIYVSSSDSVVGKASSKSISIGADIADQVSKIVFRKYAMLQPSDKDVGVGKQLPADEAPWQEIEVVIPDDVGDNMEDEQRIRVRGIGFKHEIYTTTCFTTYYFEGTALSLGKKNRGSFTSYLYFLDRNGKVLNASGGSDGMFNIDYFKLGKTYTEKVKLPLEIQDQVAKIVFRKHAVDPTKYTGQSLPEDVAPDLSTPTPVPPTSTPDVVTPTPGLPTPDSSTPTPTPDRSTPVPIPDPSTPTPQPPTPQPPTPKPNTTSKFKWGQDNFNFNNNSQYFGSKNYFGQISASYRDVLKKKLTNKEKKSVFDTKKGLIYEKWGGSCYGMSSLTLLAKEGLVPYAQFQSGASKMPDFKMPLKNQEIASLITYYQLSQFTDEIQQEYFKTLRMSNKENIQRILSLLDSNSTVLICFEKAGWGGHAILGYGYERGTYKKNGMTYDVCIKICDPNRSMTNSSDHDDCNIYANTSSYTWQIPIYFNGGVSSTKGARFMLISSDKEMINRVGYLSGTSSSKGTAMDDSYIARLDVNESAGKCSVSKVQKDNSGMYSVYGSGDDDIVEETIYDIRGEEDGKTGYTLYDGESSYQIAQDKTGKMDMTIDYEGTYMEGSTGSGKSILFDRNGKVEMESDFSNYELSMVFNYDYPTSWYQIEMSGSGTKKISLEKSDDGYICEGDSLKNAEIHATNDDGTVVGTFSTDYKSALIYENASGAIGVKVDTDDNGTYETSIHVANHVHAWKQKSDADSHWMECDCGEKKDVENHNFTSDAEGARCTDCGYKKDGSNENLDNEDTLVTKPAKVKKLALKAKKAALEVSWAKKSGITGFEVQYSLKKNMKSAKKKKVSANKTSVKLTKLKRRKTYYVRIRAYLIQDGTTVYSAWSSKKSKKVK